MSDRKNRPTGNRGSVLIVALVLSSLFLVIALSLSRTTSSEIRSSAASDASITALETAEMGSEKALEAIYKTSPPPQNLEELARAITGSASDCDATSGIAVIRVDAADGREYQLSFRDRNSSNSPKDFFVRCSDSLDVSPTEAIETVRSLGIYRNTIRAIEVQVIVPPTAP